MHLSREQAFDLWAGPSSPWSVWSKPIVFSYLPATITPRYDGPPALPPVESWAPHADGTTAIVVDLPGVRSVRIGEALAHAGFDQFHCSTPCPARADPAMAMAATWPGPSSTCTRSSKQSGKPRTRLRSLLEHLPAAAPPAFLLDAARRIGREPRPGDFDNRSVSLPTDFPSAAFLQARGVTRAVVLLDSHGRPTTGAQPATDLGHTLLRWQAAGIAIFSSVLDESLEGSSPGPINVARPSWFGALWHNALSVVGLRRNPMGGFGGKLPVPSAG